MSLLIQKEGILTTVQGRGNYRLQRFGINPGGAMDRTAARLANLLVGNAQPELVIEMHFPAAEIVFEHSCVFALGGADFRASLNGNPIENWSCLFAERSSVLKFEKKAGGNRCYLAVKGGFDVAADRFENRRLKKGDRIALKIPLKEEKWLGKRRVSTSMLPVYSSFPTVRILEGGEINYLSDVDRQALTEENFVVTNDSNRMGFRLKGPKFKPLQTTEMVSSAVSFGTIQLLPDGHLIVLMADHQTSGGYPRIANVISIDLPLLAQLAANDKVAFELIGIDEAERVTTQFEQDVERLRIGCGFGRYW